MAKRKQITVPLTISYPANMTATEAKREVRYLINTGSGFVTYPGEAVKVRKIGPALILNSGRIFYK